MKKILTIVISVALVAAIAVGGTLAYLSSTGGTTLNNTFTTSTAGSKLAITLNEGKVNADSGLFLDTGTTRVVENSYPIIPGATMDKDPTITVAASSAPCYVFAYVTNTAKLGTAAVADIGTIDPKWVAVDAVNYPGLYVYTSATGKIVPTSANATKLPAVFNTIKIKSALTNTDLSNAYTGSISVKAYAYQASGDVDYTDDALDAAIDLFFPAP